MPPRIVLGYAPEPFHATEVWSHRSFTRAGGGVVVTDVVAPRQRPRATWVTLTDPRAGSSLSVVIPRG